MQGGLQGPEWGQLKIWAWAYICISGGPGRGVGMGGFHFFTKFLQIIVNRRATFVLAEQMQYIYISTQVSITLIHKYYDTLGHLISHVVCNIMTGPILYLSLCQI